MELTCFSLWYLCFQRSKHNAHFSTIHFNIIFASTLKLPCWPLSFSVSDQKLIIGYLIFPRVVVTPASYLGGSGFKSRPRVRLC
jgi:hypothetical protein